MRRGHELVRVLTVGATVLPYGWKKQGTQLEKKKTPQVKEKKRGGGGKGKKTSSCIKGVLDGVPHIKRGCLGKVHNVARERKSRLSKKKTSGVL